VNRALAELRARRPRDGHYTLRAQSGPRVFAQTNDEVAEALAALVTTFLSDRRGLLVDAYCGAGFFTKRLRAQFSQVVGIEWDRFAIAAAREGAQPNESYVSGDVALELAKVLATADLKQTTVIVDPPSEGLSTDVRRALIAHPPATLVYVSCDPSTLARDLHALRERFVIESVTPLDMFPQTAEIEVAVHLRAP
jgi:23S rRNA (uracil1939-C5)-methyltransferase